MHLVRPDSIVLAAAAVPTDDVNSLRVKSTLFEGDDGLLELGPFSKLWKALYGGEEEGGGGGIMAMGKEMAGRLQMEEELSHCIHTPYIPTAHPEKPPATFSSSSLTRVANLALDSEVRRMVTVAMTLIDAERARARSWCRRSAEGTTTVLY